MADPVQIGDATLYLGDCLDVMRELPENSVDSIVTDPPYGINLKFGAAFEDTADEWLRLAPPTVSWGLERDIFVLVFGASSTQARDLEAFPQAPDRTLIWAPSFSLGKSQSHGYFYRWHPIYLWNVPERKRCVSQIDVFRERCDGHNWWYHPGTKPVMLMVSLLQGFGLHTVIDPFMGSGTTGVACVQTGCRFIGIEIEPRYFDIACKRIQEAQQQARLPLPCQFEQQTLMEER